MRTRRVPLRAALALLVSIALTSTFSTTLSLGGYDFALCMQACQIQLDDCLADVRLGCRLQYEGEPALIAACTSTTTRICATDFHRSCRGLCLVIPEPRSTRAVRR